MSYQKLFHKALLFLICIFGATPLIGKEMLFSPLVGGKTSIVYIDEEMNVGSINTPGSVRTMIAIPNSKKICFLEADNPHCYASIIDYSEKPKISNRITLSTSIGPDSTSVAHPDGKKLYIGFADESDGLGKIGVIDTDQEKVINLIHCKVSNLSLSPDGKWLYAADHDTVYVIDTSSDSIKTQFSTKLSAVGNLITAPTPDGKQLFVVGNKDVIVYDTCSYQPIFDVVNAEYPLRPAFTSDNKWGFIPDTDQGVVSVTNNAYKSFWTQIKLSAQNQNGVVVHEAADKIEYAYTYTAGNIDSPEGITAIKADTQEVSAWLPGFCLYSTPVFSKDGSKLYAPCFTDRNENKLLVIDTDIHHFKVVNQTGNLDGTPICLIKVEVD